MAVAAADSNTEKVEKDQNHKKISTPRRYTQLEKRLPADVLSLSWTVPVKAREKIPVPSSSHWKCGGAHFGNFVPRPHARFLRAV